VLANSAFTYLETTQNFNVDFLIPYLIHPSTAFYVGYNSNLENVQLPVRNDLDGDLLHSGRLRNDGRAKLVNVLMPHGAPLHRAGGTPAPTQIMGRTAGYPTGAGLTQNLSNTLFSSAAMSTASRCSMSLRCIMWTTLPSRSSAIDGEDGGYPAK